MNKIVFVKIGSQYVTSDGSLSPSQSDALRITVPFSTDPNVDNAHPRIVTVRPKPGSPTFADLD